MAHRTDTIKAKAELIILRIQIAIIDLRENAIAQKIYELIRYFAIVALDAIVEFTIMWIMNQYFV